MRVGEAWNLRWKDIDYEKNCVNILPEKNSDARQLKITNRLAAMLNNLPRKHEMIFRDPAVSPIESMEHFRRNFIKRRTQIAQNLQNPRINAIKFHTLRHYKGTTEPPDQGYSPRETIARTQINRKHHAVHAPRRIRTRRQLRMQSRQDSKGSTGIG